MADEPEELTATEASRRYNVSGSWLIRQYKLGKIAGRMIGFQYVFKRASIEEWEKTRPRRGDNRRRKQEEASHA